MSTCKRCGCEFDYDLTRGTGYAPDLCGAFCDGVYSERKVSALKIAGLMTQIDELRDERDALAAELATLRRRWQHVAGLAQTMGLKMDGQNSWRFQPLYHGRGPTIEAAVDDEIEKTKTEPCSDCDGRGQRWSGEGTAVTGGLCKTCCGRGTVPQKARTT